MKADFAKAQHKFALESPEGVERRATEHSRLSAGQESRETSVAVELLKLYNKGRRTGRIGEVLS